MNAGPPKPAAGVLPPSTVRLRRAEAPSAILGPRPGLTGLRGVAILLVLGHHAGAILVPGGGDFLPGGAIGVEVFFVLSGFLITSLLLERRNVDRHPIRTFYLRRALRLLPAVIVLLGANLAIALLEARDVTNALRSWPVVLTYLTNWAELGGVAISGNLTHLWSLAVEEQFYAMWPLLLFTAIAIGWGRRGLTILVGALALVGALWCAELWSLEHGLWLRIYLRTDTHADALLIGAALALLPHDRLLATLGPRARGLIGWSALAGIVAVAQFVPSSSELLYLGGFTIVAIVSVTLVAMELMPNGLGLHAVMTSAPMLLVGRLSYSLYLWHFLVFSRVAAHTPSWAAVPRVLLGLALSFLAAGASYHFVERPFLRLKDRLRPRREVRPSHLAGASLS